MISRKMLLGGRPTRLRKLRNLGRRLLRRFYECLMTTETINKDLSILLPKKTSSEDGDGMNV